jgi:MYXO-CTERM domain-containing protein
MIRIASLPFLALAALLWTQSAVALAEDGGPGVLAPPASEVTTPSAAELVSIPGPASPAAATVKDLPEFAAAPLPPVASLPVEEPYRTANVSPVPEPSALVLGAWGIAVVGYLLRRRQLRRERQR